MGSRIEIKDSIRYLGVKLHRVLGFKGGKGTDHVNGIIKADAQRRRLGSKKDKTSVHGSGE